MMISKEFRERAWDTLKRKYGKAFLVCLIVDLISFVGISMLNFSQNGAADDVVNPVNLFINVILKMNNNLNSAIDEAAELIQKEEI